MQKDKYNRNGRPLNHILKDEEIFSEWTYYEDFYISYLFSCYAQLCVHGDELKIVLLHHAPIFSCPHHSTSQCSSFLFLKCEISICSFLLSPYHLFMDYCTSKLPPRDHKRACSRARRAKVQMAFLSSQKAQVYLPHTELSTHGQRRKIST